jgi:hypothetical protein
MVHIDEFDSDLEIFILLPSCGGCCRTPAPDFARTLHKRPHPDNEGNPSST